VSVVPGVQVVPRVLVVTPVAPESLVFLVPGVLLVVLEMLVPKAKWDLLEQLVRTVAQVPLDLREPVDSLASWDSQDPKEPLVSLVRVVRKDCSVHLD